MRDNDIKIDNKFHYNFNYLNNPRFLLIHHDAIWQIIAQDKKVKYFDVLRYPLNKLGLFLRVMRYLKLR